MHTVLSENAVMLPVSGIITESKIYTIISSISELSLNGPQKIVLDFSNVTHIHYLDVPLFNTRLDEIIKRGYDVTIKGMSPYVENLMKIGGINEQVIDSYKKVV